MTNPDSALEQPSPSATDKPDQIIEEQQPAPFQPIFTLVTDSSGATHHPHVVYVFQDDEVDHLTDVFDQYNAAHHQIHQQPDPASSGSKSTTPALPNDRAIVLDLVPNSASDAAPSGGAHGLQVAWASSLSADWAVVSAALAPMTGAVDNTTSAAPPAATDPAASSSPPERLMLRIEGVDLGAGPARASNSNVSSGGSGKSGGAHHREDYNALVHEFDGRMAVLRKVVNAGAERQAKLAAAAQEGSPRSDPPVTGVFENVQGSLPVPGHEAQQTDSGEDGVAQLGQTERPGPNPRESQTITGVTRSG